MSLIPSRREEACLSDLIFDRLFAGELSADAVAEHLVSCERCRERHARLMHQREAFLRRRPRPPVGKPVRDTEKLKWGAGATLLVAAACAVFMRFEPEPEGVRLKGPARIGFFVTRDGKSSRATPDYRVRQGEQIRFVYSSAHPAYLAIAGIDAERTVSVYFPQAEHAQAVEAGADVLLPSGTELDRVLGREAVYALFCEHEFSVDEFKQVLAKSRSDVTPPANCQLDTLSWLKESAP
jgi:hypothetical protein